MRTNPKGTALIYLKDLLYITLHHNQVWEVERRSDGKYELKHGCTTVVLGDAEYRKYFVVREDAE